jgi:rhomboid protease GluP
MLSPRLRWKLNRARERLLEAVQAFVRPQPRPRVCFACGRLVGAAEKVCSHCGTNQAALSVSAFKRVALAVIPAENPVSYGLLFLNFIFYLIAVLASQQAGAGPTFDPDPRIMYLLGAKQTYAILQGEYWRLVMPILLHWGLWHLALNSLALWQIGPQVEELFGSRRFLLMYLTTGVMGNVASAGWYTSGLSAGASGSIFGLIGILISYVSQRSGFVSEYRNSLIRWAIFGILLGIFAGFDNAAHVGGLLCGMVLGRVISQKRPATPAARLGVALMGWGAAAVIAWSIAMVLLHLPPSGG